MRQILIYFLKKSKSIGLIIYYISPRLLAMLLEITVLSQIKSILSRFGSVYSQLVPRPMLLATVAIACLGNYIFRAVIVVRFYLSA